MKNITSVAAFFREANGKKVQREAVGMLTLENWEAHVEQTKKEVIETHGVSESDFDFDEVGNLTIGASVLRKPVTNRIEVGLMEVASKRFWFTNNNPDGPNGGSDMSGLRIEDNKLIVECYGDGKFEYSIIH
ncbi:hypothetical protein ACQKQC_25855 [Vibrio fortis]|uniref:hypothetical protein n=1 Tax=Vibrio fortis TaxID=212667 RepID=UPI0040694B1B